MKQRKLIIRVMCVFLAALMILGLLATAFSAYAVDQTEIDALKDEKAKLEAESEELQKDIENLESQQARYIDRKAAIDRRIQVNLDEIDVIQAQIELYDTRIAETREKLSLALADEEQQYQELRTRMRAMEESGTISYVSILLHAASLTDFLSKAADISNVMEYDRNLQDSYVSRREEVEELKADLEQAQLEQEGIRAEMEFKQQQLEAQTVAAYEMLANLESDLDSYNKAMEENDAAEEALQKELDEKMAELARQERAAAAAAPSGGGTSSGGTGATSGGVQYVSGAGGFRWPASSYLVTSTYGYRIHPISGDNKFHAGIDVGAGSGTPIVAAAEGDVATATYNDSYGNYVLVNHGGGTATLYAHMSSMAVSVGQHVTQGQVIGYVGSTGWATGPHLHFEIRVGGSTVDPLGYFSGYTVYNG